MVKARETLGGGEASDGTNIVDEDGDIRFSQDVTVDCIPDSNESIIQGMFSIGGHQSEQDFVDEGEEWLRDLRMQEIASKALENAGVYVTLDEHKEHLRQVLYIASYLSMYQGGENGGYNTSEFKNRYKEKAPVVEARTRERHKYIIHTLLPKIYKVEEFVQAGYDREEIEWNAKTEMRLEIMAKLGGPENAKARADMRKRLQ